MLSLTSQMFVVMLYPRTLDAYCSPSKHIFCAFYYRTRLNCGMAETQRVSSCEVNFYYWYRYIVLSMCYCYKKSNKEVCTSQNGVDVDSHLRMIAPVTAMAQHTSIFNMFSKTLITNEKLFQII